MKVSIFKKAAYINNDTIPDDLIVKEFKKHMELWWRDGKTGAEQMLKRSPEKYIEIYLTPVADVIKNDNMGLNPREEALFNVLQSTPYNRGATLRINLNSETQTARTAVEKAKELFPAEDKFWSQPIELFNSTVKNKLSKIFIGDVNDSGSEENPYFYSLGRDFAGINYEMKPDIIVKK